jgi:hypothetical protein
MSTARKTIRECCEQSGMTADADAPILRNVKVLGLESLNKRRYTPEAVRKAVSLYEGRMVNLNHPVKPNQPRGVLERFGVLRGVHEDSQGGLRAREFHYNPEVEGAKAIRWWADNMPEALGLSHDAVGRGKDVDGTFVVEEILDVRAVDLVADPATTKGLYEGAIMPDDDPLLGDMGGAPPPPPANGEGSLDEHVANAIGAIVKDTSLDKKQKLKKIGMALGLLEEGDTVSTGKGDDVPTEEQVRRHPAFRRLAERVDLLETSDRLSKKATLAERLISEAKLPPEAATADFREQLVGAKDEAGMRAIVENMKNLIRKLTGVQRPKSAAPATTGGGGTQKTNQQVLEQLGVSRRKK